MDDELRELSPFLSDLKKENKGNPFKTPLFYFDTLADKVVAEAKNEATNEKAPPQYLSLSERISGWLKVVLQPQYSMRLATVAFLGIAGWYFLKPTAVPQMSVDNCGLACVPKEEIQNYISENLKDFDEDLLLGQSTIADTEGSDATLKELSSDEIEQYLKENLDESDVNNLSNNKL